MTNKARFFVRLSVLIIAAVCCTSSSLPVSAYPCSIYTEEAAEEFHNRYPMVYQDSNGVCYYSNWDQGGRALYLSRGPYSQIGFSVKYAETDEDSLRELIETVFDDSYSISILSISGEWAVGITDRAERAETEEKADQLFEIMFGQYTLYEYAYHPHIERYREFYNFNNLCVYDYRPDNPYINDPEMGENLTALIAEDYPDWEVLTEEYETGMGARYTVQKKGIADKYDVPIAEYLALRDTVYQKLGYQEYYITYYPEETVIITQVKDYMQDYKDYGDVDGNGVIQLTDALHTLQAASDIMSNLTPTLTEEQLNIADVDGDGTVTVRDAQCILRYYSDTASKIETSWREITGYDGAPALSNLT